MDWTSGSHTIPGTKIKLGWFIPLRVLGCVQYQDRLTIDTISDLANQAVDLLQTANLPFYFLLDNRCLASPTVASLKSIQYFFPFTRHPLLESVLIIKPEIRKRGLNGKRIETTTDNHFIYVNTLNDAFTFLQKKLETEDWLQAEGDFFPRPGLRTQKQPG
jgi:hypothetical protein